MADGVKASERQDAAAQHYLQRELYALIQSDSSVFDFLMSGSLDGVWYWDLQNPEHEWMSPRFWTVLGYDPADRQHLSAEWQDLIDPDDLKEALAEYGRCVAEPGRLYDCQVRYRHRDGHTVWVRCRGHLIRDEAGNPLRMLGAHNEFTQLKTVEAELRGANRQLLEINTQLSQFSQIASHDLRRPLRTIASFAGLLAEDQGEKLDDEGRKYLEVIRSAAISMRDLLDGMVDYSGISVAETPMVRVSLDGILSTAATHLARRIGDVGATLEMGLLPDVFGRPGELLQVFQNLIDNALCYARPGVAPVIHISGRVEGNKAIIDVRDNGQGIAPEFYERVFEAFERLHREEQQSGSGIGLAIVKRVVERHAGAVHLDSVVGEGTTFTLHLTPAD
ncbi:MAG: PAS domain S-box-containing protein [Myxococcota bacterium]|jgi:PAS domain S-box-containing protein